MDKSRANRSYLGTSTGTAFGAPPFILRFAASCLVLLIALSAPLAAQVLSPSSHVLPGLWSGSLQWGDYDADGDPDLLAVGLTGAQDGCGPVSRIYRNDGGVLLDINAGLPGVYLGAAAWGDYDGDGDLDLALSGLSADDAGVLRIYKNTGGSFTEDTAQDALIQVRYSALAWGDYDLDGDLDLVVSGMTVAGNPSTVLYRNTRIDASRTGRPLGGQPLLEVDRPNTERLINLSQGALAWGDVDGDGDLDLALSGFGTGGTRQSTVYLNQFGGSLIRDDRNTDLSPVSAGDLAWGDVDGDGDLDLALSGWNNEWEATFRIYINAAGILREDLAFSSTRIVGCLAWGDYDNDGDLDLAASGQSSTSQRFTFVLRNGTGGSLSEDLSQSLTGLRGGDLAWADVDGDGDLDLAVSGEGADGLRQCLIYDSGGAAANARPGPPTRLGTPTVTGGGLTLNWNDGSDPESSTTALTYTLRIGTEPDADDVYSGAVPTGPGNLGKSKTVSLSIPLARDTYYWSVRAVDGGFSQSNEFPEEQFRVDDLVSSLQSLRPLQNSGMAWGDYDNDGDLDLAITGRDVDGIARALVYRNDNGTLLENSGIALQGVQDGDLAWSDYDNDDDLDLAISGADASGNRATHIYRNRLDSGDFALHMANVDNLPQLANSSLSWGDFDNDGDFDLALMGTGLGQRVAGLFRNQDGILTRDEAQVLTPMDNGDMAWGDYDGDGDLDLVAVGQTDDAGSAALILYENSAAGLLTPQTGESLTGVLASSLAWGDYDNDGDLDLAVCGFSFAVNNLMTTIYRNNGAGVLSDSGIDLPGVAVGDVAWGDYDNDGDLDLVLAGQAATGRILNVYRNQAGVLEGVVVDVLSGVDFCAITLADYDSDGDLDLTSSGRASPDATTFAPISRINDNLQSRFNPNRRPTPPTTLVATAQGSRVTMGWDAGTDPNGTPTAALTYGLQVGTEPGGNQIRSGAAPLQSGRVRSTEFVLENLTSGRYYWRVRTIDKGLLSSLWSMESSFVVDIDKPVVDSVKVEPAVLELGRRVTVVINFRDEPAGMDNAATPQVSLLPAGGGDGLAVRQLSFRGDLWIGEAEIDQPTPGGTVTIRIERAADLNGNTIDPYQVVLPAAIAAAFGGVVENEGRTVRLTISPNALPTLTQTPNVTITPALVAQPPSGTSQVGAAYAIAASPSFVLQKPATLTFDYAASGVNGTGLAIYRLEGGGWTRIGGTVAASAGLIQAPIDDFGTYALFEEATPPTGTSSLSNIEFSNRAFSPRAGATRATSNPLVGTTDIAFDLGAAATVRVEIYNRTGQLQRILEPGRPMGPGRQVVTWDGKDHGNRIVRSGLYIVVIQADGKKAHKTVAVVNN